MKKQIKKGKNLVVFLGLCMILISCQQKESDEDAFVTLMDEWADETLRSSPLTATFTYGDLEAEGYGDLASELDHMTVESTEKQKEEAKESLKALEAINKDSLSVKNQQNYELLEYLLTISMNQADYVLMQNAIQPSSGVQVQVPLSLMQTELDNKVEVEAYLERVAKLPRLLDETIAYEQKRMEAGYMLPASLYEKVLEQISGMMDQADTFLLYQGFIDQLDGVTGLSEEDRQGYLAQMLALIQDEIFPAYDRLYTEVELLANTSEATGSVSDWENGQAYYEQLVDQETNGEMTVSELEEWALTQMTDVQMEFASLISSNPDILETDLYALLPKYTSMEDIYDKVDEVYKDQFNDYNIELASEHIIPSYLEDYLAAGFYFPVTIDGKDYGNMYLPQDTYDNVTVDTFVLYLHENVPGHHLYFTYVSRSDQPAIRKMASNLTYEEGWAQYCQELAYDYMDLDPTMAQFLKLNSVYANAAMVYLDIQFHYHGLALEDLEKAFEDMGYGGEALEPTINRLIANPGEMIHYMYGGYRMGEFKKMMMEKMGDDFTPQYFHEFILNHYGLPFPTVENAMDSYIESTASSMESAS